MAAHAVTPMRSIRPRARLIPRLPLGTWQVSHAFIPRSVPSVQEQPSPRRRTGLGFRPMLGLPADVRVCLFDMDGVLTRTAVVHAAAWKQTFDEFLKRRAEARGEPFVPFDAGADYNAYVDGLPREQGVRSFLASRGIELPDAGPGDTVAGLA